MKQRYFDQNALFHFKEKGAKILILQINPICALFLFWSLILDFFNQVPNWPSHFNIYAIKPLI